MKQLIKMIWAVMIAVPIVFAFLQHYNITNYEQLPDVIGGVVLADLTKLFLWIMSKLENKSL
jgi:uncharacterized membrane protein